ncbi:MAG: hypothetical protein J6T01_01160 [Kiritimatiellae bacterium]|nr:hypothetical protein [Kiritimatiellia bacterium]
MKTGLLDNMAPNAQRAFITTLAFTVVTVILYMFAVVPEDEKLRNGNARYGQEEQNKARIDSILRNAASEATRLEETVMRLSAYRKQFIEQRLGNYATHAREMLDPLAVGAGLTEIDYPDSSTRRLPLPDPKMPFSPAKLHVRTAVRMTARGSYQSAASFILRVEEELPLVSVQSMRIAANSGDPLHQTITMTLEWPASDTGPNPDTKARR